MKEKLEVIREALEYSLKEDYSVNGIDCAKKLSNSLALLDSLIAELESPELIDKIVPLIQRVDISYDAGCGTLNVKAYEAREMAKAAINAIKGITATRDRE